MQNRLEEMQATKQAAAEIKLQEELHAAELLLQAEQQQRKDEADTLARQRAEAASQAKLQAEKDRADAELAEQRRIAAQKTQMEQRRLQLAAEETVKAKDALRLAELEIERLKLIGQQRIADEEAESNRLAALEADKGSRRCPHGSPGADT